MSAPGDRRNGLIRAADGANIGNIYNVSPYLGPLQTMSVGDDPASWVNRTGRTMDYRRPDRPEAEAGWRNPPAVDDLGKAGEFRRPC